MNIFKFFSKRLHSRDTSEARRFLSVSPCAKPLTRITSDQTASQSCNSNSGTADTPQAQDSNIRTLQHQNRIDNSISMEAFSSDAVEVVEAFFEAQNRHASLEELLQFADERGDVVRVKFDNTQSCSFQEMMMCMRHVFESFPDCRISWESIRLVGGVVVVEGHGLCGTHDGTPFGFGPFPPIPATHKFVSVNKSRILMSVGANGKITKVKVVAEEMTGLPALYVGIGGSLELPLPPEIPPKMCAVHKY